MNTTQHNRLTRTRAGGFTLIETSLTTVIIGVGVLALIEAQQAFMRSNDWSTHSASGAYLAGEVRELTRNLPRHDPVTGLYLDHGSGTPVLRGWGPEPGEDVVEDFDDLDDFDGLTFAFNGTPGTGDADLPGPIDAFGTVIPEIDGSGVVPVDADGQPMPLQGWSQTIRVEKVDPFDSSVVHPDETELGPDAATGFEGLDVDRFPLRVTVGVSFQGPFDTAPTVVSEIVWIVP